VLGNAMKFTPREGSVTVTLERVGEAVMLRVRDNGIGLDTGLIDTLFVPFAQAHQPLDRTDGGLGLGLALVKHLVELHDGSVAVSSDGPGRGTELAIRIPLTDGRPRERVAPVLSEVRRRVLVIEDNFDAAETLRDMLASYGHEIRVAHDGPSGLAAVEAFDPEVVLCDLGLPGMSGYEVCRTLRADTARRRILIALSGYAQPDDRASTAAVGFDDHVAKPPTSEELHRAITMARDNGG
jgi:CheY-like chemotaxis protein